MAVQIECVDLVKRYGKTAVLDGLNWTVAAGGVVGLLGGSGVGKTTLLRLIAGLDRCSAGKVTITTTASAATSRRPRVGMVFQNLALWPHLSTGNILSAFWDGFLGKGVAGGPRLYWRKPACPRRHGTGDRLS